MEQMSETNSRTLECTHTFHTKCLNDWKKRVSTCPMCRKPFDQPTYNVRLSIEPIGYEESMNRDDIRRIIDMFNLDENIVSRLSTTIDFSVETTDEIRDIIQEIGFGFFSSSSSPSMNLSRSDTEGGTEL